MDMQRENGTTWADGKSQQPTQVKKEVAGNNLIKKKTHWLPNEVLDPHRLVVFCHPPPIWNNKNGTYVINNIYFYRKMLGNYRNSYVKLSSTKLNANSNHHCVLNTHIMILTTTTSNQARSTSTVSINMCNADKLSCRGSSPHTITRCADQVCVLVLILPCRQDN